MLFVWIGFLKPEIAAVPQAVQRMTTDFLAQPSIRIRSGGPLLDPEGAARVLETLHGVFCGGARKPSDQET